MEQLFEGLSRSALVATLAAAWWFSRCRFIATCTIHYLAGEIIPYNEECVIVPRRMF